MVLVPAILIISNKHDFATDHVVFHLKKSGVPYLRLNRDQFSDFQIAFQPTAQRLSGTGTNFSFEVTSESLRAIYFRAPVYLRDIYQSDISPNEQLQRTQWAAFVRGLTVFDCAFWMNHPQATYQAEIKPYQLYCAEKLGFDVPGTVISNAASYGLPLARDCEQIIVKTLDPTILSADGREAFIYTNSISMEELTNSDLACAPVIIQESLIPKIDIRVTLVRDKVFAVAIKKNGLGIDCDWRTEKFGLQYEPIELPPEIESRCRSLTKALRLPFGAIDLAYCDNRYYFLEINPTGEWAWLLDHTPFKIDEEIATTLIEAGEKI
jgi:glutathione synthase/RimK-type ligase-like ATP-grasp enzyme